MAVKIRLRRTGRKKQPSFRLVVADERSPRDGRFIEIVGNYKPLLNPPILEINMDKINEWMKKGAKPTTTVRNLLKAYQKNNIEKEVKTDKNSSEIPAGV